jgi:opacity protein-like surface antigen
VKRQILSLPLFVLVLLLSLSFAMMKRFRAVCFFMLTIGVSNVMHAQVQFSIATDISAMRHLTDRQQFWTLGQTVQGNFHFTPRQSAYAWINYFIAGKFSNTFTASAKQPGTIPQEKAYTVNGSLRIAAFSLGWKPYFKGSYNGEDGFQLYGLAGFGLAFIKAENSSANAPDTVLYQRPAFAQSGSQSFTRMTLDVGIGVEQSLGGGIYLYGDVRGMLPVSSQPSAFAHTDAALPKALIASAGIRLLIGN